MSQEYTKIRINSLHPNRPTTFDLFVMINQKYVHYLHAGDSLTQEKISKLTEHGNELFFIKATDWPAYQAYIHEKMNDDSLDAEQKAIILKESAFTLVEELFENPDLQKSISDSSALVTQFVDFIEKESEAVANLIGLSSHDFYTYNHSLDVSIYSIGLGQSFGYEKELLVELGKGALFHDIGKRMVATEIICKQGPLDDVEWAQMKQHPTFGLQLLNEMPNISDEIKACVFEHHEHWEGNGYPQGISKEEIHPFGRIVAITDCYDAMTTKRSYNKPMRPSDALTMMKEKLANKFDPELMNAMYSVLFKMKA